MKENDQPHKLLVFPDAARYLKEPKLPPSRRKVVPISRQAEIIDLASWKALHKPDWKKGADPDQPA